MASAPATSQVPNKCFALRALWSPEVAPGESFGYLWALWRRR